MKKAPNHIVLGDCFHQLRSTALVAPIYLYIYIIYIYIYICLVPPVVSRPHKFPHSGTAYIFAYTRRSFLVTLMQPLALLDIYPSFSVVHVSPLGTISRMSLPVDVVRTHVRTHAIANVTC